MNLIKHGVSPPSSPVSVLFILFIPTPADVASIFYTPNVVTTFLGSARGKHGLCGCETVGGKGIKPRRQIHDLMSAEPLTIFPFLFPVLIPNPHSPPGLLLLLLPVFLHHIKLSRMSPAGLVCDRRLLQRYIRESFELEDRLSQCRMLPLLQQPVPLPLVGFNLREWATKTNPSKGKEVLLDLVKLVEGITTAQQELNQGCPSVLLQQLFEKTSFFVLQLQNLRWQEQDVPGQPEGTPRLILESNLRKIFQTYKQLLRGKLHFLFSDLRKDLCSEGDSA
ncbi:thrombopoietin isoform X1 [Pogona vitticeps]